MITENINEISKKIRQDIFITVCKNKAGHLASSLSSVEILATLYLSGCLNYDVQNLDDPNRDRFVMSKGHSALALYYTLAYAGFFPKEEVYTFCLEGTKYGGLATTGKIAGIEATTGSLGHGMSFAAGVALAGKLQGKGYHVFCMVGDGELQEGEIWEAAMFAAHHKLNNCTVIIDNNKIQATGFGRDIIDMSSLAEKWKAFGFDVIEVDGHNPDSLVQAYSHRGNNPVAIIAHTIKGKGLSFASNKGDWHYKLPTIEQIKQGCCELDIAWEDYFSNEN